MQSKLPLFSRFSEHSWLEHTAATPLISAHFMGDSFKDMITLLHAVHDLPASQLKDSFIQH